MTRLSEIRDEIMHRHVRTADAGADGEDAAIASAILDFYETAKGIEGRHTLDDHIVCARCGNPSIRRPFCWACIRWLQDQEKPYDLPGTPERDMADRRTDCPAGCGHSWWTVGGDSYDCAAPMDHRHREVVLHAATFIEDAVARQRAPLDLDAEAQALRSIAAVR